MCRNIKMLFNFDPPATDEEIREMLAGNLCRCTGYHFIVDAVAVVEKIDNRAVERIQRETGVVAKSLASISLEGGVSRVVRRFEASAPARSSIAR